MPRPCERRCNICGYWKHHSRFRSWKDPRVRSLSVQFAPSCKDCETKKRNEHKNKDRALWIMEKRTKDHAAKQGVSFDFMWINMNWKSLVPILRVMMTDEALCTACGHAFDNERDVQLDHNEPPRYKSDYARMHARNISLRCASCNTGKSDKPYAEWLDEQEQARLSNEVDRSSPSLFEVETNPQFRMPF